MTETTERTVLTRLDELYRNEASRVLATLIRLLGDFDLAEEALHDAFRAALEQWPGEGMPDNPRAWLVSAGRFKAIDRIRRDRRLESLEAIDRIDSGPMAEAGDESGEHLEDDRLRLIFICCHPSLASEAQVALTLREICGLTTEEIAKAFLSTPATVAQRIVRAKNKIRAAGIPYEVPEPGQLSERLDSVLQVIYLVFNEGYSASSGQSLLRHDLSAEAIRLARLILELLPERAEIMGLLALMLLQDSRRAARSSEDGDLILLEQQDRSRWDRAQIAEGAALVEKALRLADFGAFAVQAAIAAVHAEAPGVDETDWHEIIGLYDLLLRIYPSPVVELNRAVAVAMRDGPEAGLILIEDPRLRGQLRDYRFLYAAEADMHRRLGQAGRAAAAYRQALKLTRQEPERRFLQRRLAELKNT